jgi:UDP-N-acetylglucosamine diphosphorylase / glucose-1-phosphate thymidylyltransferase / UDP-N-acetylgalactosamine diphosphorylase / glucosamine-1-phosphate N-acetyltransferase / galactosamine-1-phosphate N-acetyltransferase
MNSEKETGVQKNSGNTISDTSRNTNSGFTGRRILKAVIFAAGKGVRMRPLTNNQPKVMVKLNGKPLLEHMIEALADSGIKEVALIVGYKKDAIENHFGKEFKGVKLYYIVQEKQEGTAHALGLAEGFAETNFLVVNGDVIVEKEFFEKLVNVDEFDPYDILLVAREVKDTWRYGVLKTSENEVKDIVEKPAPGEEPGNLINAGIYRFDKKIFKAIKLTRKSERNEFELVDSIRLLIKAGAKAGFVKYSGKCFDIGSPEDLKKAEKEMKK